MFADLYEGRVESGALRESVRDSRLAPPEAGQAPGTMSEVVVYFDEHDREVAEVHRYLTLDGRIGASGLLDPISLLHDGRVYRATK